MGMFVDRALNSFPFDSPLVDGNHNRKRRKTEKIHKIAFIE
jgi:hypothetical protein